MTDRVAAAEPRAASRRQECAIALLYGFCCHFCFVAGVGTMMVMMFFGMTKCFGTLRAPWSYLANFLLLMQFAPVHSALLSRRGQMFLRRLAPFGLGPRLTTTTYALVASLQVWLLFLFWSPSGIIWWQARGPLFAGMCCLYAIAWMALLKAIVDAGFALQTGLLGWRAVMRHEKPVYPPMPVNGLFRLCRQPIYVAFALTLWTVPVFTADQCVIAVVLTLYCLLGPLLKEARFGRLFGDSFMRYRQKVPYWLPWRGLRPLQ